MIQCTHPFNRVNKVVKERKWNLFMSGAYIFLIIITVACMRMKCMPLLTKRKNCNLFCFLVNTSVHLKYLHVLFDDFFSSFFINECERKKWRKKEKRNSRQTKIFSKKTTWKIHHSKEISCLMKICCYELTEFIVVLCCKTVTFLMFDLEHGAQKRNNNPLNA